MGIVYRSNTLFVSDTFNSKIRSIELNSTWVYDFAGSVLGSNDGTVSAQFYSPTGITIESSRLYVADPGNFNIRQIDDVNYVSTVAGRGTSYKISAPVTSETKKISLPNDLFVGVDGFTYVADTGNSLVRKISPSGTVTNLAGGGYTSNNYNVEGNLAVFYSLGGIVVNPNGTVFVSENNLILRISATGFVTRFAGSSLSGFQDG